MHAQAAWSLCTAADSGYTNNFVNGVQICTNLFRLDRNISVQDLRKCSGAELVQNMVLPSEMEEQDDTVVMSYYKIPLVHSYDTVAYAGTTFEASVFLFSSAHPSLLSSFLSL